MRSLSLTHTYTHTDICNPLSSTHPSPRTTITKPTPTTRTRPQFTKAAQPSVGSVKAWNPTKMKECSAIRKTARTMTLRTSEGLTGLRELMELRALREPGGLRVLKEFRGAEGV